MKAVIVKHIILMIVLVLLQTNTYAQWENVYRYSNTFKGAIYKVIADNNNLYSILGLKGLLRSTDMGETWTDISENLNGYGSWDIFTFKNQLILNTGGNTVLYSTDNGETWHKKKERLKDTSFYQLIALDDRIVAVTYPVSILISKDSANSWERISIPANMNKIRPVIIVYRNGILYLIDYSGKLCISEDKGENWKIIDTKFNKLLSIEVIGKNIIIGVPEAVIISDDEGKSFKLNNHGLPQNQNVKSKYLIAYNGLLYLAMSGSSNYDNVGGVFVSPDTGKSWYNVTNNLTNRFINWLVILNKHIFCNIMDPNPGMNGGIFRANLDELLATGIKEFEIEISKQFYAAPPHPNPASNMVKAKIYWNVKFTPKSADSYICDIYGQKVNYTEDITITNIDAHSAEISWNCSKVSPGVYFIVINYLGEFKSIPVVVNR